MDLQALDRARGLRGWNKGDLARRSGINPLTVSELYRHGYTSSQTFAKIVAALEAHPPAAEAHALLAAPAEGAA